MCGIGAGKVFPNCLVGKNMSWLNYNDFTTPSSLMWVLRRTIPRSPYFSVKHDIYPGWCQIQVERNWKEFSQKKWTPSWSFELYDNYLYKLAQCIVYSYLTSWTNGLNTLVPWRLKTSGFWTIAVKKQWRRREVVGIYRECTNYVPSHIQLDWVWIGLSTIWLITKWVIHQK